MTQQPTGPVVAGVDGSSGARDALALAADEAMARVTPLVLVHVTNRDGRDRIVEEAAPWVQARHPTLAVTPLPVTGDDAAAALSAQAVDGSLLVVGHRGHNGRHGDSAGSVALRLLAMSPVPVLVYRPFESAGTADLPRPIVVGVRPDGGSEAVVEFAADEATLRGAALHVLCASTGFQAGTDTASVELTVAETVQRWTDKHPGLDAQLLFRHGLDPAIALATASHGAQLVVVGAGCGPRRAQPGSVAHALVHRAGCPVAVVPIETAEPKS
jgi:nucleotide-binding universal stress UspA family protein